MYDKKMKRVKLLSESFHHSHYGTFVKPTNDKDHQLVERLKAIFFNQKQTQTQTGWHNELQAPAYWQMVVFQSLNKIYSKYKQNSCESCFAQYTQNTIIDAVHKLCCCGYPMFEPELIDHLKQNLFDNVTYTVIWCQLSQYGVENAISLAANFSIRFFSSMPALSNSALIKAVDEANNEAQLLQHKLLPILEVFIPELKQAIAQTKLLNIEPIYRDDSYEPRHTI